MPLSFLLLMDSVMTRPDSVRCGKWPGSVPADPGCARIIAQERMKGNPPPCSRRSQPILILPTRGHLF